MTDWTRITVLIIEAAVGTAVHITKKLDSMRVNLILVGTKRRKLEEIIDREGRQNHELPAFVELDTQNVECIQIFFNSINVLGGANMMIVNTTAITNVSVQHIYCTEFIKSVRALQRPQWSRVVFLNCVSRHHLEAVFNPYVVYERGRMAITGVRDILRSRNTYDVKFLIFFCNPKYTVAQYTFQYYITCRDRSIFCMPLQVESNFVVKILHVLNNDSQLKIRDDVMFY